MIHKSIKLWKPLFVFSLLLCLSAGMLSNSNHAKAEEEKPKNEDVQQKQSELADNFLKADGKVLRDHAGKGDVVTLRGTNIGGWQVMESWFCPTNASDQKTAIKVLTERFGKEKAEELFKVYETAWFEEQDFELIKELNFNVIRLPISYYNLLDDEGKLRADTLETLDWFVDECGKRDIYVILDLHAAPGSQNGRDHSGDKSGSVLFTDETAQNLTVSLWEQLAGHYKGNPTIAGYDLLNEPEGNDSERYPWGRVQLPFFDRLYQAIRAIDPDHIIILNSVWEPTNMPQPSKYGWENVMYEYHYYCWDGTDDAVMQRNFTDAKVKNDNSAGFEVPVLIGEFTLFEKLSSWKYALEIYEKNGWSWTTWTYKTVGQGNWGIFNSTAASTPKVNIYQDSEETIRNKWSKVSTSESFTKNKYMYDLLRSVADENAAEQEIGKWFQNADIEDATLRAGTDAEADIVSSEETHSKIEESKVIRLTINGTEKLPTATSRNVCITPAIRASVDTTGMDYLLFDTYVRKGNQALQVTFVDKTGATWTGFTSPLAMPMAYQWEKLFIDLTKAATIDRSAIIEVRIGANAPGTYYFDNIYFAQSYIDPLPKETVEEMQKDSGVKGQITDWVNIPGSSEKQAGGFTGFRFNSIGYILVVVIVVMLMIGTIVIIRNKKNKGDVQ
jgi:hypothetical protein